MAEFDKDTEELFTRGTDWEVVSLTASAYAASPGSKGVEPLDQYDGVKFDRDEHATSDAMFMSGHFVFPPNEHENLPIDPVCTEICRELEEQELDLAEEENGDGTDEASPENWKSKSSDDVHRIECFEKGKGASVVDVEFGESKALHGMTLVGKDQVMYEAPELGSFDAEANVRQSVLCGYSSDIPETDDPSEKVTPVEYTDTLKSVDDSKFGGSGLPCEAWWKRHTLPLYSHSKEANKLWSVVFAAAVVGLVIWGYRWRREKLQLQQLKLQSIINREMMSEMEGSLSRRKDISSMIRGVDASTHLDA